MALNLGGGVAGSGDTAIGLARLGSVGGFN